MKKIVVFLLVMLGYFGLNAQTDEVVIKKKEVKASWEKEKAQKSKPEKTGKSIYVLPDFSFGLDVNRGVVVGGGVRLASGTKKIKSQYFGFNFSVPIDYPGSYKYTALGCFYKTHPFGGSFGRMLGVGFDFAYFFKSDIKSYSEFFFGGKVKNTFKGSSISWGVERIVFAPRLDILVPIKNIKIGISSNPLIFGYWDYLAEEKKFDVARRWYNVSAMIEWTIPSGNFKKFKEEEKN